MMKLQKYSIPWRIIGLTRSGNRINYIPIRKICFITFDFHNNHLNFINKSFLIGNLRNLSHGSYIKRNKTELLALLSEKVLREHFGENIRYAQM
jgi:hypothetical protein